MSVKSMAEIADARETAVRQMAEWIWEEVLTCRHQPRECNCEVAIDLLDAAQQTAECPSCEGRGRVNWHRATYSSPAEPCERGCESRLCRESDCRECPLAKGRVLA